MVQQFDKHCGMIMAFTSLNFAHFKCFTAGLCASIALLGNNAGYAAQTGLSEPSALPDIARAMLEAAAKSGDADDIDAVAQALKAVFVGAQDAIDAASAAHLAALGPATTAQVSLSSPSTPNVETGAETIAQAVAAAGDKPDDQSSAQPAPSSAKQPTQQQSALSLAAWDGAIDIGATVASGNSSNIAAGLAIDAKRVTGLFTHNVKTGIDIASSDGARTQERWFADYQLDATITERSYAYLRLAYEEDAFSGFDYRLFGGGGFGHYFYQSEPFTLKLEGGPGYRYSLIDDNQETESEIAFYGETELDWLIRKGVLLEQDINGTWTDPTSTITSVTALTTSLTEAISTAVSFQLRYETNPPTDRDNVDTLLKASIKYGF